MRVVLQTDRAFLLSMAEPEQRELFADYEREGFLKFEHGGGLDKMLGKIDKENDETSLGRLWVLFDSDRLRPDEPSHTARKLDKRCGDKIPHHMLERRSMENYLPLSALAAWAVQPAPRNRRRRLAAFEAFKSMNDDQRHCFNMKKGFAKDRERTDATPGDLYADLSPQTLRDLAAGFSSHIGKLFEDSSIPSKDLAGDGGWHEINREVTKLIRYIQ